MMGLVFGYISGGPGTAVLWAIADISIVWLIGKMCERDSRRNRRNK